MKISATDNFLPRWASPPGDTISELLAFKDLGLADFARVLQISRDKANALISGQGVITASLARLLEQHVGGSVTFWLSRESQYRQDISRIQRETESDSEWLREFPISEMRKFGWISPSNTNITDELLHFFDVIDVPAWRVKYRDIVESVAFRTSPSFESELGAIAAWIRQGERQSETIHCGRWTPARFKRALFDIRQLTRKKNPASFIPELQTICAACGVAVVVLRSPTGCRASGATFFLSPEKAMILLSFRYLSDDHFWFTFFHEAGHLLLHERTTLFVEGAEIPSDDDEEREANQFAADVLIPREFRDAMLRLPVNGIAVIQFAREIGVSPGIVVGQLQHHGRFTHRQLNNLKRRFTCDAADSTAETDEGPR
jgi:HTH-type transcriptional regulator/antitoxin HigA